MRSREIQVQRSRFGQQVRQFYRGFNLVMMCLVVLALLSITHPLKVVAGEEVATHRMILSHHEFEPWSFEPRAGDLIEITNTSDIAHSIYITYPDGQVLTLGDVQLPGQSVTWKIPADGEYLFKCWIHPVINAKMQVQPAAQ